MLSVLFFLLSFLPACGMQHDSISYRYRQWKGDSFKDKERLPKLEYLAARAAHVVLEKDAQLLSSPEFLQNFTDDPEQVSERVSSYSNVIEKLLVKKLLKKYESLITAAHIHPIKLIADATPVGTLLQYNYDGRLLAVFNPQTITLKIWHVHTGRVICEKQMGHGRTTALRFNRQGDRLAVGRIDGAIDILDMQGAVMHTLGRHPLYARALCFNDNGSLLASRSESSLYIWNVESARILAKTSGWFKDTSLVSFKNNVMCIDKPIDTCRWEAQIDGPEVIIGRFKRIVSDKGYYLWADGASDMYDLLTRQKLAAINHRHQVVCKSLSDDGNFLAIASQPHSIQVFECPQFDKILTSISLLQTLYTLQQLQDKDSLSKRIGNMLIGCCSSDQQQNDFCVDIHNSLPLTFKKIINR